MLNQVLKVCQQFVEDDVKISNIFGFSIFTSNIFQVRWISLWRVHRQFSYELSGKRILKNDPHVPKLITKVAYFFETQCSYKQSYEVVEFTKLTSK